MALNMVAKSRGMIRGNFGNDANLLSHEFETALDFSWGLRTTHTLYFRSANVDITHIFAPCEQPVIVLRLLVLTPHHVRPLFSVMGTTGQACQV